MEEEIQESEVIFQENIEIEENDRDYYEFQNRDSITSNNSQSRKRLKKISNSIPISIPDNLSRNNLWFKHVENSESIFFEDEEYCDDGEMIPPHVITGRRIAGKMMSFSICSGYGRTLKGRDLSQVRDSILRMTGFLET
uniref:Senescence regulator n=1 Tax=Solanum lycopersicum TaxID=4081 RepID=A0A3Q7FF49_SOLLC